MKNVSVIGYNHAYIKGNHFDFLPDVINGMLEEFGLDFPFDACIGKEDKNRLILYKDEIGMGYVFDKRFFLYSKVK